MTLVAAVEEAIARGGDADEILRTVVQLVAAEPGVRWAGIHLAEGDELVLGPTAGDRGEAESTRVPIAYRADTVGELEVEGELDRGALEDVAGRLSPYVLLGWDTGGEAWEP